MLSAMAESSNQRTPTRLDASNPDTWPRPLSAAVLAGIGCLLVAGCGGALPDRLSTDELARCAEQGSPVTIGKFVTVGRKNGATLTIKEKACKRLREGADVMGSEVIVTNAGYTGLDPDPSVTSKEGSLICQITPSAKSRKIFSYRYPTDTETKMGVMNIYCSLYPSDAEHEAAQIARFRRTLEALVRDVP
jgi:hypothetical protein